MKKLEGQVVIITGGARGIGEGICKIFCNEGATVALWDVLEEGRKTADHIAKMGGRIFYQNVDVSNQDSVDMAVAKVISEYGKIDVLINNAGIIRDRSILKMSRREWDQVMRVNVDSLYITAKAIVPHMKTANYGRIISASSINAYQGAFGQTNYSASKAAIVGFTHSLCREVGKYNITVNAVAPGFIKTEMTDSMPEDVVQAGISMIPVGRIGTPEDMGHAYLFLASKEAGFISGHTLHANGGAMPV
ncbi:MULTISPECIES: SDR family NAD(P)-dependent oxidoreductase [unclassified Arenibacter]|uniref:SDR family NAD(P)-dependent oxidoreductase n=1 Tax=unclassified Arenibacter TaxID=2615047 RepID=UPI000E357384|nr:MULTISPECIES: 3-oxoacyl-ACP reductase FabG [unclassified Arenibacter]MCM4164505.1 3-oxoacyl-ACP reductase [Arenibacter sp. A80]RFT55592.1 SDR family oxidoreductase [Arenibacter sp. P308M17]